jgi:hypothetical protein
MVSKLWGLLENEPAHSAREIFECTQELGTIYLNRPLVE